MGQAKTRGPREDRIAQAQKRAELERSANELAKQAAAHARAQRLAELTPEARRRVIESGRVRNLRLTAWVGLAFAIPTPAAAEEGA